MEFEVNGINLIYKKVENYESIEKDLRTYLGTKVTCYVDIPVISTLENTVEFIRKINFLFSFCRGNIINYSRYSIYDMHDIEINTTPNNPISSPFTSLELIPSSYIQDTQNFLSTAYKEYEKIDNLFMVRKIAREYPTTRNSSTFLNSRSLILTAMVEYILFCFNKDIDNLELLDKNEYLSSIEEIKNELSNLLKDKFGKKNKSKITSIIQKMDGLNSTTLNWKFEKFINQYRIPISGEEIKKFKNIRDSLAHTLSFPEEDDKVMSWKFLVNIIDKIVMGLFCYEGQYYNIFVNKDEYFQLRR